MALNAKNGIETEVLGNEEATRKFLNDEPTRPEETVRPNTNRSTNNAPVLGFKGITPVRTLSNTMGSEYVNKIQKVLQEIYKADGVEATTKVLVLDKENVKNLAFSSVLVAVQDKATVAYYVLLLEATGRKPQKAREILEEIQVQTQMRGGRVNIWTASDSLDNVYFTEIQKVLIANYPAGTKFINVDGTVVPYTFNEVDVDNFRPIAADAYNVPAIELARINNEFKDLNITAAVQEDPNSILKAESDFIRTTIEDKVGNPKRHTWGTALNYVSLRQDFTTANNNNQNVTVVRTGGFIDSIPEKITMQLPGMIQPVEQTRLHPAIIVDLVDVSLPTFGYAFLSLITSFLMLKDTMWVPALTPQDSDKEHNVGVLNILTNIGNDAKGGKPIDLFDSKLTSQDVYTAIRKMYALAPTLFMDVELYGPETAYTSIIAAAASKAPGAENIKQEALKEIVEVCRWLTNYNFPENYNINDIINGEGILIPLGKFTDAKGNVRDIREIDLAMIANLTNNNIDLLNKWTLSNLPQSVTGLDPFITKIEVINAIAPEAEITGKALRVNFTNNFITVLSNAAAAAGLDIRQDNAVTFNNTADLSVVSSYFKHSAVETPVVSFVRTATPNTYNTYYTPAGTHRVY